MLSSAEARVSYSLQLRDDLLHAHADRRNCRCVLSSRLQVSRIAFGVCGTRWFVCHLLAGVDLSPHLLGLFS